MCILTGMDFEWDARKNAVNVEKHGIDFEDAIAVFARPYLSKRSDRPGEERWIVLGEVNGRCVALVHTIREGRYRIISARRARKDEEQAYRTALP